MSTRVWGACSVMQKCFAIASKTPATIIDSILCGAIGPRASISASLGIRGDHFKSVQTFRHGRLSSAEVAAASSLSQWHRAGVGGGQRAGESWHFIKVAHLTDSILASPDPLFPPAPPPPFPSRPSVFHLRSVFSHRIRNKAQRLKPGHFLPIQGQH